MAKIDEIKQKLRIAVTVARKQASEQQINEAAEVLQKRAHVEKRDLRILGEQVVGDPDIFASTDTDDMNNLLGRLGDK